LTLLETYPWGGSLGWFYGLVTEALDWFVGNGEGKTMGLAAFTDPSEAAIERLREFCPQYRDGRLVTPRAFDPKSFRAYGGLHFTFERREAVRDLIAEFGREEIAAAAQRLLEEQVFEIVDPWVDETGVDTVATAGGVFMNVTLNRRLVHDDAFDDYHIFPAARDGGLAAGAALAAQAERGDAPRAHLDHVYYGPTVAETATGSIPEHLRRRGIPFDRPDDVPSVVADRLANGAVVAWCRGRMEYGPRALGRRSILIDPTREDSKDRVNENVKFRDSWRPFAPSILERAAEEYFVDPSYDPFMITSYEVRPERRDEVPSVVHVDGTARPQMVRRSVVPDYWALIDAFADRTGTPIVLNTSYNLSGDPIVCSVDDALQTFFDCGLDVLVVGDCVVSKRPRDDEAARSERRSVRE
jgi:carbamoyltransferase